MEAYLDNAATTRQSEAVKQIMLKTIEEDYGNPSSKHNKGMDAENYIKQAAERIAQTLSCTPKEIVFTSGGTESNNMALIGTAMANKRSGMHIISSAFEHASVYNPLLFLEDFGFEVEFAPVDKNGHILLDKLVDMVRPDTILVSIMYVNNEVGTIEDIAAISKAVKEKNPQIIFHADAIQAYGKLRINPKKEGIDLMSVSGHKLCGPKGSGFLYIADKTKIKPIIYGGGQQKDRRSGTENVPAIAGIGQAAKDYYENHSEKMERMYRLKARFIQQVLEIEGTVVNAVPGLYDVLRECPEAGAEESANPAGCLFERILACVKTTAPHIVSVSFEKISKAEVLLHALEEKGVYVSSGSACSSNHPGISGTLKAIGVKRELQDSTLRFSFSVTTTEEEIDYAAATIKELLPAFRRYRRF